ncbi:MAG: hypothetical protein ACOX36_02460 [Saccharofermentanales bacterium]|jgi:hypothetical protein
MIKFRAGKVDREIQIYEVLIDGGDGVAPHEESFLFFEQPRITFRPCFLIVTNDGDVSLLSLYTENPRSV